MAVASPEVRAAPAAPAPGTGRGRRGGAWPVVLLVLLCLLVRAAPAAYWGNETADIAGYHRMADIVLAGHNIYFQRVLFPYTPLPLFLAPLCLLLAQAIHLPFWYVMRWPAILSDAAIVALLYAVVRRAGGRGAAPAVVALCYALNPVAILVSAFHGNVTPAAVALGLGAYYVAMRRRREEELWCCALLLGLAIAFRSYPVLWLPLFLIKLPMTWRQRAIFTALAALPSLATLLPFVVASGRDVLREAFGYSGFPDHGWVAIVREMRNLAPAGEHAITIKALLQVSKRLFLAAYALLVIYLAFFPRWLSLAGAITASTLMFYAVYGGVSSQYLQWVLPFGLLSALPLALAYTPVATGSLVSYYATHWPDILWGGRQPWLAPRGHDGTVLYLVMLVQCWLFCLLWLGVTLAARRPGRAPAAVQLL